MSDIAPFSGGTPSARGKLNTMREEVNALSKLTGDGRFIMVNKNVSGATVGLNINAVIGAIPHTTAGTTEQRMRYKSMQNDYIVCRTWDGSTEGDTDIYVAKPWMLQRTPFDGQTRGSASYVYSSAVQRVSTISAVTETQVVVPSFIVNDEIVAKPAPIGGTGVAAAPLWVMPENRAWSRKTGT